MTCMPAISDDLLEYFQRVFNYKANSVGLERTLHFLVGNLEGVTSFGSH